VVHFLLLCCVLIFSVLFAPEAHPHGLRAGIAAMLAVSAMACQFALLRLALPGAPSTAVMTGNVTKRCSRCWTRWRENARWPTERKSG
jgi:uncharacterized membrane protein YoaK (UPF0700 family)